VRSVFGTPKAERKSPEAESASELEIADCRRFGS